MSRQLFVVACLVCGCSRTERTSGPPVPTTLDTHPSRTHAVSRSEIDAGTPPLVASGISSAASAVRPGTIRSAVVMGYTSGLSLEADTLTYCDNRGGRALDLVSGVETARERPCNRHEERNRGCGEIDFVESVREPDQDELSTPKKGLHSRCMGISTTASSTPAFCLWPLGSRLSPST